ETTRGKKKRISFYFPMRLNALSTGAIMKPQEVRPWPRRVGSADCSSFPLCCLLKAVAVPVEELGAGPAAARAEAMEAAPAAETGSVGGGTGGIGGGSSRTSSIPQTPQQQPQMQQPIFVSGRVMLDDGTPAPLQTVIERVCQNRVIREGYTDSRGYFSFQLGQ